MKITEANVQCSRMSFVGSSNNFAMNSALQRQLLRLGKVFEETVKAGATIQEERPAIHLKHVGGQLKSCLNTTIRRFGGTCLAIDMTQQNQKWGALTIAAVGTIKVPCQWRLTVFKTKTGKNDSQGNWQERRRRSAAGQRWRFSGRGKGVGVCYTCFYTCQ